MRPALVALGFGAGALLLGALGPRGSWTRLPPGRPSPLTAWSELVSSRTAEKLQLDNTPPISVLPALRFVAQNVLDPLRFALGQRVAVTSGYRSPAVNRVVGGAPNSLHLRGRAVDIVVEGMMPAEVAALVRKLRLPVSELTEYPGRNGHLHVAI